MKKILIASLLILLTYNACFAASSIVRKGIATYKSGNYIGAYQIMGQATAADPGDALAQYYYAISAVRIGKKETATKAYNAVVTLNSNKYLVNLAQQGLTKLGTTASSPQGPGAALPSMPTPPSATPSTGSLPAVPLMENIDSYMTGKRLDNIKDTVNKSGQIDPSKIQNMKDLTPNKKSELPSQEEITKAVAVLVKAGVNPMNLVNANTNNNMNHTATAENLEMSMMMNSMGGNNNNNMNMLPLMMMMQQQQPGNSTSTNNNSEYIKSMITNMMMPNMGMFSSSNDNQNNY